MKIAFFSTQSYDKEYFERFNTQHELLFFEVQLNEQTTVLARGCNAVCAFVNDRLNAAVLNALKEMGVKISHSAVPVLIMWILLPPTKIK